MMIIADIGGTYIRFARATDGQPSEIQKYKADDYPNLGAALQEYCDTQNISSTGDILIATAGYEDNGVWKITNNPGWEINPQTLKENGWNPALLLNDFEAAAFSLTVLAESDLQTLKQGKKSDYAFCLLGVGTGLGLAYHRHGSVQKTHGGHIPIASLNDQHEKVINEVRARQDRAVIFEDIVSGPGLQNLKTMFDEKKALALFHEFLGIFAATAIVTGHAYGGLYLTGGVITSFIEEDQFDFERFEHALCFDAVDCVKSDIASTSVHYITDPYPALKGLIHAQSLSDN